MTDLTLEYNPRVQFIPFHQRTQRWACMVCHRRAGKTVACVNDLIAKSVYTKKKAGRFAYIAPFYRQAKDVAWGYLKDFGRPVISKIRESELRVELITGAQVTLYGADNPDALRGMYFDGVILDEFGDCRPSLWGSVVLPTLIDRQGWAVFIGTPKGKNHFYRINQRSMLEDGWFHMMLQASTSDIIGEQEIEEMRAQMSEDEYEQEMECSFDAALQGTFFSKYISSAEAQGRVTELEIQPEIPVHVSADLGRSDSTAFWYWQDRPDGRALIDYDENSGPGVDFYIDLLKSKPFYSQLGDVWLPHDAVAKTLATKRSTLEQMKDAGFDVRLGPRLGKQDQIEAARFILSSCYFNATPSVAQGLDALRSHRRRFSETTMSYLDTPLHDWSSDGSDSFMLLAMVCRDRLATKELNLERPNIPNMIVPGSSEYDITLDRLYAEKGAVKNWNPLRIR